MLRDLDGVLVGSAHAIARVYRDWARRHGLNEDLVVTTAQGRPSREVVRVCAPDLDPAGESAAIDAAHSADQDGVVAIAGAGELLASTPPERLAVVTSCSVPLARARFIAAGLPQPAVCITEEQVARAVRLTGVVGREVRLGVEPRGTVASRLIDGPQRGCVL
ncbi:MAG: hypothetical protein ACRDLS_12005 [Solirubrobacteraceae bacterium]